MIRNKDKINVAIIDDEPNCIINLKWHIEKYCPKLNIIYTATTLSDIIELIKNNDVEVAFLDIQFYKKTIFSLLEEIDRPHFFIIFVTAYAEYAINAFKVDALDYIMKPLSEYDITRCYQKILKNLRKDTFNITHSESQPIQKKDVSRKIILKEREYTFILSQEDVCYLKAMGAYTEVVFNFQDKIKSIIVSKTISTLQDEYRSNIFFRVHKSYLVNLKKIIGISGKNTSCIEMYGGAVIPVAKRRAHDLITYINK